MIKSKSIEALKALNRKELRELGDFINSPFFNKNKTLRKLLSALKPYYPAFLSPELTKESIYAALFPGKPYADKTMRNLLSDLMEITERYLSVSGFNNSGLFELYFRSRALARKGLNSVSENIIDKAETLFNKSPFDGGEGFYLMHLIEMEKDFISISRNKLINLNMNEGEYLIYSFLSKYLIFKMKYFTYRYKLGTEKLSELISKYDEVMNIDRLAAYFENNKSDHAEIILIYYYCTRFLNSPEREHYYEKVRSLLKEKKEHFSRNEILNLYLTFSGFCISQIRAGKEIYNKELFDLYEEMLNENLVVGENESSMHITIFNNIVGLAIRLEKLDWAKRFIENYSGYLIPEFRDTMVNFAFAQIYFSENRFAEALASIGKVNFENYYLKSGSRILQIKIYYELGYTEPFFSLCDSLKHYLAHDKLLPADKRQSDNELVSAIGKLYRLKLDRTAHNIDAAEEAIRKEKEGPDKQWLIRKFNEIRKSSILKD